jgi:hypothetical protein
MGGEIADAQFPFGGWRSIRLTELLRFYLDYPVATDAFVCDRTENPGRVDLSVCYGHIMVSLEK